MVRGRGYARSLADLENIVVAGGENGAPIRIKDIGQVAFGPELRRGVSDLDGTGEAVSGIVIMPATGARAYPPAVARNPTSLEARRMLQAARSALDFPQAAYRRQA